LIDIDADIAASVRIRGMLGDDTVQLHGVGASALRSFKFEGETGNDTFVVDYRNGDPLPMAGFDFNFVGGLGIDNASVTEVGGTSYTAYFVDRLTDATDNNLMDGKPDSSNDPEDQISLRAAIQEANIATAKRYIFLPSGSYALSVTGAGGDTQGDFDINKNVAIIGTGAGESRIDASGLTTSDRVFDVQNGGVLNLSRVTVTGGKTQNAGGENGGGISVRNGGTLNLTDSAVVGNVVGDPMTFNNGGGIYFWPTGGGTIVNSVIAGNTASRFGGGVFLGNSPPNGSPGVVTMTNTIVANNTATIGAPHDINADSGRAIVTNGGNRVESTSAAFTPITGGVDYVGSVDYVVTGVADTYYAGDDPVVLSLRDAINLANTNAGAQEIWLPAWNFVLTKERDFATQLTDTDISFGDLDIGDSLTIRGAGGVTNAMGAGPKVSWRTGTAVDAVFDLLGDYNGDGITTADDGNVTSADWVLWQNAVGSTTDLRADGNDNGVVDAADETVWSSHFGNTLQLV
jgi:hypothetical protein